MLEKKKESYDGDRIAKLLTYKVYKFRKFKNYIRLERFTSTKITKDP